MENPEDHPDDSKSLEDIRRKLSQALSECGRLQNENAHSGRTATGRRQSCAIVRLSTVAPSQVARRPGASPDWT